MAQDLRVLEAKDILTKGEFQENFKRVLEIVLKKEKGLEKAVEQLQRSYNALIDRLQKDYSGSLKDLKSQVNDLFVGEQLKRMDADLRKKLDEVDTRVKSIRDGKPGRDADEKRVAALVRQMLGADLKSIDTQGKAIIKLDEFILGLRKLIQEIKTDLEETKRRQRGGFKQIRMIDVQFAGDDSTTDFTLDKKPGAKGKAIWMYYNGQAIFQGVHYTISGKTLTTTFTPETPSPGNTYNLEGVMIIP